MTKPIVFAVLTKEQSLMVEERLYGDGGKGK